MDKQAFAVKHLLNRSLLSILLYPASLGYAGYMLFRRKFLFRHPHRASFKVISIGNLTSGGSGKTPLTIALAKALQAKGISVAIASRGYLAEWEDKPALIFDGQQFLADVSQAGDEASMVASQVPGIPVFVGRDRSAVIDCAAAFPIQVLLLDDALQHLKVARDIDLVVFDSQIGLGNGWVIPAGYLREPLSALPKTAIILLHSKNAAVPDATLMRSISKLPQTVYQLRSQASHILQGKYELPLSELSGKSLSLVSGIAHPDSFERSVKALGLKYEHHYRWPDHFAYTDAASLQMLREDESQYLLCTQKDAIKLQMNAELVPKVLSLVLKTTLDDSLVEEVMRRLKL